MTDYLLHYSDLKSQIEDKMIMASLSLIPKGSRVLDLACGIGVPFDAYLKKRSCSITGVDLSYEYLALNTYLDKKVSCGIQKFTSAVSGEYDAVISTFGTYFHVSKAPRFMNDVNKKLVDGGIFILVGYNAGRKYAHFGVHEKYGEYWEFNKDQIVRLAIASGFEIVKVREFSPVMSHWLQFLGEHFLRFVVENVVILPEYTIGVMKKKGVS